MKKVYALTIFILAGCSHNQPIVGDQNGNTEDLVWFNEALEDKFHSGIMSIEEIEIHFEKTKSNCEIESLKIHIPSPSCYQPPRQDCSGMTGLSLGFCQSYYPQERCDYSAYNRAIDSQSRVYLLCMRKSGYKQEKKNSYSSKQDNPKTSNDELHEVISSIPKLSQWAEENGREWERAIEIDEELRVNPAYQHISIRDRFLIVTKMVEAEFNPGK